MREEHCNPDSHQDCSHLRWDDTTAAWKLGDPQETQETQERAKTAEEIEACKPETKTEYTKWVDGDKDCATHTVIQTRTKKVTSYTLDEATKTWKAGEPVLTKETQKRPMGKAEKASCPAPKAPQKLANTGSQFGFTSALMVLLALAGVALIAIKRRNA